MPKPPAAAARAHHDAIIRVGALCFFASAGMAAMTGAGIVPQLFAHAQKALDVQPVFLLPTAACYLCILPFGMRGHRAGR